MEWINNTITNFQMLYAQHGALPLVKVAVTLCTALLIYLFSRKIVVAIQYIQRSVQQSKSFSSRKPLLLRIIRTSVKHASWIFLLVAIFAFDSETIKQWVHIPLLDFFLYLALSYELVNIFLNYFIDRVYRSGGSFIYKALLTKSDAEIKHFAKIFCLISTPLYWTEFSSNSDLYALFSWSLFLVCLFLTSKKLLELHRTELTKFISRQLPNSFSSKLESSLNKRQGSFRLLILLIIAYIIDRSLSIHNRLLRFQFYKSISAKLLWIHLEQLQAQEEIADEENLSDHNYSRWFSSSFINKTFIEVESFINSGEKLTSSIKSWLSQNSSENDLIIYGANGVGKSTFILHWLEQKDLEFEHIYKELDNKYTLGNDFYALLSQIFATNINNNEDLLAFDESLDSKTLVILDNCENLFISTLDGFSAYKNWLGVMNLPLKNIFWVFLIDSDPYYYLNDVFGRLNQFSHSIKLGNWNAEELRALIMSRHESSKRKLTFDSLLLSSIGNDEYSSYSASADRCFLLLAEISNGNPSVAMSYWTEAASKIEGFAIEIGVPEKPSATFLKDYNSDLLFIYASIIRHKRLGTEEAAKATRQSISVAQRAMKLGIDNGFLFINENNRYAIKTAWVPVIHNFLLTKNYLHID